MQTERISFLTSLLLAVFGCSVFLKGSGGLAAVALLLVCLWARFSIRDVIQNESLVKSERWFVGLLLIYLLVQLAGGMYQPEGLEYKTHREIFKHLDYPSRWLILLPLFFLFRRHLLDWRLIITGLAVGMIATTLVAVYQVNVLGIGRATGGSRDFATFGSLLVASDLIVGLFIPYAWKQGKKVLASFLLLACLVAFYGSLLSLTRGVWLAYLFFVLIMLGSFFYQAGQRDLKALAVRAVLMAVVYVVVTQTPQYDLMQQRAEQAVSGYVQDGMVGADKHRTRLFMLAIDTFERYPFGIGTDNFAAVERQNNTPWNHAHNELLNTLAENGIQGGLSLLALVFCVTLIFFRGVRSHNELSRLYGQAGLTLVLSYAVFSLTDAVFSSHGRLMFFVVFLYLFLGQISFLSRKQERLYT